MSLRHSLICLALTGFLSTAYAGFDEGVAAADKGDFKTAMSEWQPLAEQGYASAQFNLGLMYDKGEGVVQDYKAAVAWHRKAAEQGHVNAQYNLGVMYGNGRGVPQDYKAAVAWYRKAAEQGDASSQFNLGFMYGNGRGVPQDDKEAYAWSSVAAASGDADAVKNRDILAKKLTPDQLAKGQELAKQYFEKYQPK